MTHTQDPRLLTGVAGLDKMLNGGLIPHRAYLIRGESLLVSLGEAKEQLRDNEKVLREFDITQEGLQVGQTLHGMRGLMNGVPEVVQPNDHGENQHSGTP